MPSSRLPITAEIPRELSRVTAVSTVPDAPATLLVGTVRGDSYLVDTTSLQARSLRIPPPDVGYAVRALQVLGQSALVFYGPNQGREGPPPLSFGAIKFIARLFWRTRMVPAFGNVGWRLEDGEFGVAGHDPRTSPYGWHIIKLLEYARHALFHRRHITALFLTPILGQTLWRR